MFGFYHLFPSHSVLLKLVYPIGYELSMNYTEEVKNDYLACIPDRSVWQVVHSIFPVELLFILATPA